MGVHHYSHLIPSFKNFIYKLKKYEDYLATFIKDEYAIIRI
jgi:hypothetical protein